VLNGHKSLLCPAKLLTSSPFGTTKLPENFGYVFMAPVSHGSTASNDEFFLAIFMDSLFSEFADTVS